MRQAGSLVIHLCIPMNNPLYYVPLFNDLPERIHLSLGSERGFIGAALNSNATHLLKI